MNTRRGFFKSLAKAAAIIALAPQIAFRVRPEVVGLDLAEFHQHFVQIWAARGNDGNIDILTDRTTADRFVRAYNKYYQIQPYSKFQQQSELARAASPS